jgi:hypothetical protein
MEEHGINSELRLYTCDDATVSAAVGHVYPLEQFKEAIEQSLESNRRRKIMFNFNID